MAMSYAERQKLPAELKKRLIRQVAEHINECFNEEKPEAIYLAADKGIHHQLLSQLDETFRERIEQSVAADLTKIPKSELLDHFESVVERE
jgi:hypothetical protein